MTRCPTCEDTEKIKHISKFLTGYSVEIQCICGSCGNIFREILDDDAW